MKNYVLFLAVILILILACSSSAQAQERRLLNAVSISPGIGFEYFSRTINWDDETSTSKLKSHFFTIDTEIEFPNELFFRAVLGFSSSKYDSLIFRELPLSIELDVGNINGYILGADVKKSLVHSEAMRIDVFGQFFYGLGKKTEWEIPGLAVEGSVEGKPTWMRVSVGPVFTYTGLNSLYPYLYLSYNTLWGKFNLDQVIQDLTGNEEKKIKGESSVCVSPGFTFKLTGSLSLKSEASIMPYKDGIDFGVMIKVMYSFY
jgi:hypothetical protein